MGREGKGGVWGGVRVVACGVYVRGACAVVCGCVWRRVALTNDPLVFVFSLEVNY